MYNTSLAAISYTNAFTYMHSATDVSPTFNLLQIYHASSNHWSLMNIYTLDIRRDQLSLCLKPAMTNFSFSSQPPASGLPAALARYSESSIYAITHMLRSGEVPQQRSGAYKRKVAQVMAPCRNCFTLVAVPHISEATPVRFAVANLPELLRYVCAENASFQQVLQRAAHQDVRCILSHDECTAGNVVDSAQQQKVHLIYLTFDCLQSIHESSRAWLPVGAITHEQAANVPGGMGMVTAAFLREWARQQLDVAPVCISANLSVRLRFWCFLSDMDGQRGAVSAKGSAGLKPCIFCHNVLYSRGDQTAERDSTFHTISESRTNLFEPIDSAQLVRYIAAGLAARGAVSKAQIELRERCLGYHFTEFSIWNCPTARGLLDLSKICNDWMHLYFANGIASSELLLLYGAVREHTGLGHAELRDLILQAKWRRSKEDERGYWCKRLFVESYFSGQNYKGSASQCLALVLLLRYYVETVWQQVPALAEHCHCFLLLCRCIDILRTCAKTRRFQELETAQVAHHEAFRVLHPNAVRPKHHHRLHLPQMFAALDCIPSMWAVESKHRDYKGTFSSCLAQFLNEKNDNSEFSARLMPRMLLRHSEMLKKHPMLPACGFELLKPFSAEEVERTTGLANCEIAARLQLPKAEVHQGSVLLWPQKATIANFFLRCGGRPFVHGAELRRLACTQSHCIYRVSNDPVLLPMEPLDDLMLPQWICSDKDTIVCLP